MKPNLLGFAVWPCQKKGDATRMLRGNVSVLFCSALVFLTVFPFHVSGQSVIYNNGAPNHNSFANNITFFIGAEDFTLSSTQTINAARIWVYGPGYSGSIHWTIYANASNQPGNILASDTSKATLTSTGFVSAEGFAEYIVDFSIDAFTATAGTTYWLGVQDAIPNPTVFPPSVIPFDWEWTNPNSTLTSWFYGYGCCGAPTGWYQLNYSSFGSNQGSEHAFELLGEAAPCNGLPKITGVNLSQNIHQIISIPGGGTTFYDGTYYHYGLGSQDPS